MWRTRTLPWFVLAIQPAIVGLVALHGIARSVAELAVLLVFLGTAVRYLVLAVRDDPVRANWSRAAVPPAAATPVGSPRSPAPRGAAAQRRPGAGTRTAPPGNRASARRRRSITPIM